MEMGGGEEEVVEEEEEGRRDRQRQAHRQIDYTGKLADARTHSHTHTLGRKNGHPRTTTNV